MGYVGPLTRAKINTLMTGVVPAALTPITPTIETSGPPSLFYLSKFHGPVGTQVTLHGLGFSTGTNDIRFGTKVVGKTKAENNEMTFTIPESVSSGRYSVSVKNSKGISKEDIFFIVTKENVSPPVITSISPSTGKFGDTITLTGRNFTSKGNEIRSGLGIIPNLSSSNGTTITFKLKEPEDYEGFRGSDVDWPVVFFVANENGVSGGDNPVTFMLNL